MDTKLNFYFIFLDGCFISEWRNDSKNQEEDIKTRHGKVNRSSSDILPSAQHGVIDQKGNKKEVKCEKGGDGDNGNEHGLSFFY